jgi:hypothetical protein
MSNHRHSGVQDVERIAGQILSARYSEPRGGLRSKLAQARKILPTIHPRDTFEQEKLEVLQGAMELLESPVIERAQAALQVLEQLANGGERPVIQLSRPA